MTHFVPYVKLVAKPGREKDVATFLPKARDLVMAEAGTIAWFAAQFDKATFAIFDAFNDEAGLNAHLAGAAVARIANAADLLAAAPEIHHPRCSQTSCPAVSNSLNAQSWQPRKSKETPLATANGP
jgi:quinol monooxygenase YgiN